MSTCFHGGFGILHAFNSARGENITVSILRKRSVSFTQSLTSGDQSSPEKEEVTIPLINSLWLYRSEYNTKGCEDANAPEERTCDKVLIPCFSNATAHTS